MNIKEIEALIKFVQRSGVNEVKIEDKDFKITIITSNKNVEVQQVISVPAAQAVAAAAPVLSVVPAAETKPAAADDAKYITIKSPMIGTFYRTASPDKPPFVNVGDEIKVGQVICIIEAMKLFNEIESEFAGKVVKVLVDSSKPVEYDQPLFLIEPM